MTGKELKDKINYLGMAKKLRRLALEKKLESAEELAVMTLPEICDLILSKYVVVYSESDEIGLVDKDKIEEYNSLVEIICR